MATQYDPASRQQQDIEQRALTVPDQARALTITTNEGYEKAGVLLLTIKELRKEIDNTFDPIIKAAHSAHKEAVAQKKKVEAPLAQAEGIIKPRIASYNTEQERKRKEEEARREAEARKQAEEAQINEAAEAEKTGDKAAAEAILNRPVETPPVVLPTATPKVDGLSFRKQWKFRITDESKIPREYLIVDEKRIRKVIEALKDQANIPGVQAYCEDIVAAGKR